MAWHDDPRNPAARARRRPSRPAVQARRPAARRWTTGGSWDTSALSMARRYRDGCARLGNSRDIRLAGSPPHDPKAEVVELDLRTVPEAAGRTQGPGSEVPGAAADHPRPTAGVTLMTRIDRPLDLGVAGGPGVQASSLASSSE